MSYALVGLGDLPVRLLLSCVSKAQRISNEDFFFCVQRIMYILVPDSPRFSSASSQLQQSIPSPAFSDSCGLDPFAVAFAQLIPESTATLSAPVETDQQSSCRQIFMPVVSTWSSLLLTNSYSASPSSIAAGHVPSAAPGATIVTAVTITIIITTSMGECSRLQVQGPL